MNTIPRFLALILSSVLILSPGLAFAQTASSSTLRDTGTTPTQRQNIRGWWHQSSGMQQAIAALPTTATQAIPMPVLFGVAPSNLTPNFGDPRDNGARTHEGEDIMAVKGTPIVSPTQAVVLKTETGVSEGNAVYTANPGGETFVYMHLDHFGEGVVSGQTLQAGSLIGYVGNTGDAAGGPAHLHFEVHNPSGSPTDPFPRLTAEFTPAQKAAFLTTILGITADPTSLANFLVTNFRSTFLADLSANIPLPVSITNALATIPASTPSSGGTTTLPPGDLDLGSSGSLVVTLQNYLIQNALGPAAKRLAQAGATGNFGPITQAALIEFQTSVGISPASGYYGAATRAYVTAHPITTPVPPTVPNPLPTNADVSLITRDLYYGITGGDVAILQKFLNAHGFTVAATGAGSTGNESTYFGAATQAAVIKFQIAYSISPAAGYVGPITRSMLLTVSKK